MLYWAITMFALGVLAFLDNFFNYGEIFRMVNSLFFMLLALGVLIRTRLLTRKAKFERLIERNENLERQIENLSLSAMVEDKNPETAGRVN